MTLLGSQQEQVSNDQVFFKFPVREEVREPAQPAVSHAPAHRRLQAVLRRLRKGVLHPVQAGVTQAETHW